ncbi:MAG: hypothetical protein MK086_09265 [Flavobacteriales bacterium]|nr:hypothetical protein [Flavobacteriales bacterium]
MNFSNNNLSAGFVLALFCLLVGCGTTPHSKKTFSNRPAQYEVEVINLTDEKYPDNPDIGFRSSRYQEEYFKVLALIIPDSLTSYDVDFKFTSLDGDVISFNRLNLAEFIPTIPHGYEQDEYLTDLSLVNQEWNRNQVSFSTDEFDSTNPHIVRVDIARNCLNAYLWEIIVYEREDDKILPMAHGWFDFPEHLYAELFTLKNGIKYSRIKQSLEHWIDPESRFVDDSVFRKIKGKQSIPINDLSDEMYPISGARKKKLKEIIYPTSFSTMRDLQTDSALFATFTPPGFYNRKDPRTTQLGRFYTVIEAELSSVVSEVSGETLDQIKVLFMHKNGTLRTNLTIGGVDFEEFPILAVAEANRGWKSSMGFGNHTFYESYGDHLNESTQSNPYYAYLTDHEGNWLDSHAIGIDGPIFHFTDSSRTELHLWLLSFERHALVGHYQIQLN